jgi:hypothetical protein
LAASKPLTPPPNNMGPAQLKQRLANSPGGAFRGHGCWWYCDLPISAVCDNDFRGSNLRAIGTEVLSNFILDSFKVAQLYCIFPVR